MRAFRRSFAVLTVAVAMAFATLLTLGFWQLERLQWKEQVLVQITERTDAEPVSLGEALSQHKSGDDVRFLRVALRGRFEHAFERHYYAIVDGAPVWRIITPLRSDSGSFVLVDRGFVPDDMKERGARPESVRDSEQDFVVQLRAAGTQGWFVPDNNVARNEWYWRDLEAMSASVDGNSAPFLAEAVEATGDGPWPAPAPLEASSIANRHFEYAVTWFALAGVLIAVYLSLAWSRRKA